MAWTDGDLATPDNMNNKSGVVFNVKDDTFGATGDGSTDDTVSIQSAIDSAVSGGVIFLPASTGYVVSQLTVTNNNTHVLVDSSTSVQRITGAAGTGALIQFSGTTINVGTLTSGASKGASALSVANSLALGDTVLIESEELTGGVGPIKQEMQVVLARDGSNISVYGALRNDYDASSDSINVFKVAAIKNCSVSGGIWQQQGNGGALITFDTAEDCVIENLSGLSHGDPGIGIRRSRGCVVRNCRVHSTTDPSSNGYGFQIRSGQDNIIENCSGYSNRHSFDIARGSTGNVIRDCVADGDVLDGFVIGHGQEGHGNLTENCKALNAGAKGFIQGNSSYTLDYDNTFRNCIAVGCDGNGFFVHQSSRDILFDSCSAEVNAAEGFRIEDAGTKNVRIVNSNASGNGTNDIVATSSSAGYLSVENCKITKTTAGIAVELAAPHCSVTNSDISGGSITGTGIRFTTSGNYGKVIGNTVNSFANRCVQMSGVHTHIVANNIISDSTDGIDQVGASTGTLVAIGNIFDSVTDSISTAASNNSIGFNLTTDQL